MSSSFTNSIRVSIPDRVYVSLQQRAASKQQEARAQGTFSNRRSTVTTYLAFAFRMGFIPATPSYQQFTAYIEYITLTVKSPKTVMNKVSHVRAHMTSIGEPLSPFYHPRVMALLEAIKRDKVYVPRPKSPIPMEALRRIILQFKDNPVGRMERAVVLLLYHGALRQSEALPPSVASFLATSHLTRGDVRLSKGFGMVLIKAAKNLQYHDQQRDVTLYPVEEQLFCPITSLMQVIQDTPTAHKTDPMFMFPDTRMPVPTTYMNKRWRKTLIKLAIAPAPFSLHSLRKAAATEAHRAGCSDQQIKDFGGWASDAYKTYIVRTLPTPVHKAVTQAISK